MRVPEGPWYRASRDAWHVPPLFSVRHGRQEVGFVDQTTFLDRQYGPRVLLLGGRAGRVTHLDWERRVANVEATEGVGRSRGRGTARLWGSACAGRGGRSSPVKEPPPVRPVVLGHQLRCLSSGTCSPLPLQAFVSWRFIASFRRPARCRRLGRRRPTRPCGCVPPARLPWVRAPSRPRGRARPAWPAPSAV